MSKWFALAIDLIADKFDISPYDPSVEDLGSLGVMHCYHPLVVLLSQSPIKTRMGAHRVRCCGAAGHRLHFFRGTNGS
jgi:hypothetical protein